MLVPFRLEYLYCENPCKEISRRIKMSVFLFKKVEFCSSKVKNKLSGKKLIKKKTGLYVRSL
jgi:hypothetical protein